MIKTYDVDWSDAEGVKFRREGDKIYVVDEWPERVAISRNLLERSGSAYLHVSEDLIIFTLENGRATYRRVDENDSIILAVKCDAS